MAQAFFFSSTAQPTTLSASISNTTLSIPLAATTGFPVSFPFTMAIDYGNSLEELVTVNSLSGLNANVIRGVDGTSAAGHSVSAPVRHVSAARDFNTFYIHIGSTSGVHGIVGNVVGDTDTQTLTNKTLTNPTINAATLSGTMTGAPTLSGNVVFSGAPSFTGIPTFSGNAVFSANPNFTGNPTFSNATFTTATFTAATLNSGTIAGAWTANNPTFTASAVAATPLTLKGLASQTGSLFNVQTSAAANILQVLPGGVSISNQAVGTVPLIVNGITGTTTDVVDFQFNGTTMWGMQTTGILQATQSAAANEIVGSVVPSVGSFDMFRIYANGKQEWGPGNVTRDTNLYRLSAGVLQTDNSISALGNVTASNIFQSSVSFTPTISGGAFVLGNGTIAGLYSRAGQMVHVQIFITCGSTSTLAATGNLTLSLPFTHSAINAYGNAYFTKTSGGSFFSAQFTVGASSNTGTIIVLSSSQSYNGFSTNGGAAVAAGSIIGVDMMMNL